MIYKYCRFNQKNDKTVPLINSYRYFLAVLLLVCLPPLLISCQNDIPAQTFYTWQGIGSDKWASVWLINRKIDPKAAIRFIPVNEDLPDATAFDIPKSQFVRTNP